VDDLGLGVLIVAGKQHGLVRSQHWRLKLPFLRIMVNCDSNRLSLKNLSVLLLSPPVESPLNQLLLAEPEPNHHKP
jgi:hypothetical protein